MIYITGDIHGDPTRFSKEAFPEQSKMTKEDYVIVCGDFGLVWDQMESRTEEYWLNWLQNKPFTTLFVDGNHENHDRLDAMPVSEWNGGNVHFVRPNVIHLMRGQVFTLCEKTFFTFGGASSHDIQDGILEPDDPDFEEKFQQLEQRGALFRVNHRSWWVEELPSEAEYLEARANLEHVHWNVDYIISHCCPSSIQDVFSGGLFKKDALTEFFDEVCQRCTFRYWS